MLIDILSSMPGASPAQSSTDRLFTGNYKSNGNLVSFKVDIIDISDFQRFGCLSSSDGCSAGSGVHSHNITGTLVCQPDSNTVRLNISLLPPTPGCAESKQWSNGTPDTATVHAGKEQVKSWPAHLQPLNKPVTNNGYSQSNNSHDPMPPLLDFQSDQLLSEIHNITFDLKDQLSQLPQLPQLYNEPDPAAGRIVSPVSTMGGNNPLLSQHHSMSPAPVSSSSYRPVSSMPTMTPVSRVVTGPSPSMPPQPVTHSHPTLLQPKLERSDSICSEYTPMKEEFLPYTDDLTGLDDIDNENSLTPPTSITSPLLFSPTQSNKPTMPTVSEKNTIFFSKSFENTTKMSVSNNSTLPCVSSAMSTPFNNDFTETRKPFTLAHNESPKSFSSSPVSSPHETPITLLTSPKSRNRRNSSFDETKPHVCNQCGARFTTKSNLGQHAKIHLAVKPFICEICNHGFTRAAHYESHVAKHKGLKTHRCDQCGESFARLDNLLRHSARHKHGKIFDCATCGKGFHRKDKLLEHEKVHSEYSFPCPKCSKTFHTNDALKHHLPLHEDTSKTQCKICLKFINIKSLTKHMSAFHKESVKSLENNNNNNISTTTTSSKSRSRARSNNNPSGEKIHGCQYCKKSFVSPAKLRLHTAKFHAEERLAEAGHPGLEMTHQLLEAGQGSHDTRLRFYDDNTGGGARYGHNSGSGQSPSSSDGMPSQQVPEMEMSYLNSSPEDISDFGGKQQELSMMSGGGNSYSGGSGANTYSSIPTIHIPEFDNIQSKMGDNSEISTEAIQALLFP